MKLLVGLGNPGSKYENNRHNIGFMAVDEIARIHGFHHWRKRFQGQVAEGTIGSEKCLLLKPTTYMNESGRAVSEAARFYKVDVEDIYVFHDELDLNPGKVKVKSGGGNAGHNGLKSISAHMGNDYIRIRLGIGHPGRKDIVHKYVLNDFSKSEKEWLLPLIEAVGRSCTKLLDNNNSDFLNDIAQVLKPADDIKKEKAPRNASAKSGDEGTSKRQAKGAASSQSKHSNQLADKLKDWFREDK